METHCDFIDVDLSNYAHSSEELIESSKLFYEKMKSRRTIRDFSSKPVPREVIENCIKVAGLAPNGANKQPWHFAAISSQELKDEIREVCEEIEEKFYAEEAGEEWTNALKHLKTNAQKPFLSKAPYIIAIFNEKYGLDEEGHKEKNYYIHESIGIATGFLIAAFHNAGLTTLTYTPLHMGFLRKKLNRPVNERGYMLLVVGYPEENATMPDLKKKDLSTIASFH